MPKIEKKELKTTTGGKMSRAVFEDRKNGIINHYNTVGKKLGSIGPREEVIQYLKFQTKLRQLVCEFNGLDFSKYPPGTPLPPGTIE